MKRTIIAAAALMLCLAASACGPTLTPKTSDSPSLSTDPVSSAPTVRTPESETAATEETKAAVPEGAITDESGDFVYDGKLQQIGDDDHGYIQVPLGYVRFQDVDVEGLVQYSDVSGRNIFTLTHYEGTDYQTAANNLYSYMSTEESIEGLSGAQVSPNGYNALQLYGHYTDGYFIVTWLIEDPADPASSYYLCLEFDSDHQYMMACSSTFQTVEDYHNSSGE